MDIYNSLQKSPYENQRESPRRNWGLDLEEKGVPELEIVKRVDVVAVARNPYVTACLLHWMSYRFNTCSSSGSRQNLYRIKGHRLFPFGSDSGRFRVLLLQSSGRKSSKSGGNTERASSATCENV